MNARLLGWIASLSLAVASPAATPRQQHGEAAAPARPSDAPTEPSITTKDWVVRADLQARLPTGIVVRELSMHAPPLRAFVVEARLDGAIRPEASQPKQGLRTTSAQAKDLGALVAINGGYFAASGSVSAVVDEGALVAKGAAVVSRGKHSHPVTRAAIGFDAKGHVDCAWTWPFEDTLYAFDAPAANAPGHPAPKPQRDQGKPWRTKELVGGGPMLLERGTLRITEAEECCQGVGRGSRHPRTAAGWTKDGRLLLLVIDGRSETSRGATLEETAQMLLMHGAEEGLNLDGGGSTTLWVQGEILNQPSDKEGERPVASILALLPKAQDEAPR